jgi:hypothetical protein
MKRKIRKMGRNKSVNKHAKVKHIKVKIVECIPVEYKSRKGGLQSLCLESAKPSDCGDIKIGEIELSEYDIIDDDTLDEIYEELDECGRYDYVVFKATAFRKQSWSV